jgi:hypothetical protein
LIRTLCSIVVIFQKNQPKPEDFACSSHPGSAEIDRPLASDYFADRAPM